MLRDGRWVSVPQVVYYDTTSSRAGRHPMPPLGNLPGLSGPTTTRAGRAISRWQVSARGSRRSRAHDVLQDIPAASQRVAAQTPAWIRKLYEIVAKAARCRSDRALPGAAARIGAGFARLPAWAEKPAKRCPSRSWAEPSPIRCRKRSHATSTTTWRMSLPPRNASRSIRKNGGLSESSEQNLVFREIYSAESARTQR